MHSCEKIADGIATSPIIIIIEASLEDTRQKYKHYKSFDDLQVQPWTLDFDGK